MVGGRGLLDERPAVVAPGRAACGASRSPSLALRSARMTPRRSQADGRFHQERAR